MSEKNFKRLLIVSHNCLSKTGSNGRTLMNYLVGWDKEKIAQFYIHPEKPDFSVCKNYFCITDSSIMRSILKRKPAGRAVYDIPKGSIPEAVSTAPKEVKRITKNSAITLIRELAWMSSFWNSKKLNKWIDNFSPEVILFQAGDAAFLFRFVRKIAAERNIPVVIYNTEGYYFKPKSYMAENAFTNLLYPIVHQMFCREYRKLLKVTKHSIYNCDLLCDDYNRAFNDNGCVIMNTSEFTNEEVCQEKEKKIIYAGNLGLLRHKGLIEFAEALKAADSEMVLEVYGKAPDSIVEKELNECIAIKYNGLIPYDELKKKLTKSKYLLHVESFHEFYKEDLKYAFSTKIADSLASGACLFVYAPENMAVCQYLKDKNATVLITEKGELKEKISQALQDDVLASEFGKNGRKLALENHNILKNREKFQKIIID